MVVYLDVLFFINFIMDFILLSIVNKIAKKRTSLKRLLLGALLGALILCCMLFIPKFKVIYNIIGFFILSVIIIFASFTIKDFREFIKLFLLLHIVAFTVGGTGVALFYCTNIGSTLGNFLMVQMKSFSFKILIGAVIVSFILLKIFINLYGKFMLSKRKFYNISINLKDKIVKTNGLVDTGNTLQDPFTKMPVVIVESSQLNNILPCPVVKLLQNKKENNLKILGDICTQSSFGSRLRLIPFSSLGKENGMLLGFKPDYIMLENEKKDIKITNVIIGISNKKLASDDSYHALIHPELIN